MLSSWNIEKDARAYPTCKSFTFMHLRKNCVSIRKSVKKANNIQHQTPTSKQSLNSHLYTISSMILNIMDFSVMGYKYLCMCVNYTQNCMCIFHQYYLWFKFTRWARKASVRDEANEIWWQKCEQKSTRGGLLAYQERLLSQVLRPKFWKETYVWRCAWGLLCSHLDVGWLSKLLRHMLHHRSYEQWLQLCLHQYPCTWEYQSATYHHIPACVCFPEIEKWNE